MARKNEKLVAELGALLGLGGGRQEQGRGCWPTHSDDLSDKRRCWPDPADLRKGDDSPADAVRKAMRGRWL